MFVDTLFPLACSAYHCSGGASGLLECPRGGTNRGGSGGDETMGAGLSTAARAIQSSHWQPENPDFFPTHSQSVEKT